MKQLIADYLGIHRSLIKKIQREEGSIIYEVTFEDGREQENIHIEVLIEFMYSKIDK